MGIRDDELHAFEPAPDELAQEGRPEGLGLRGADVQTDDLAPPIGVDRHGDYRRDRDDAAALAHLQVGGVEPEIGPLAGQGTLQEGQDPLVDVLAELGDLALADP